jgi:hypothetical protein
VGQNAREEVDFLPRADIDANKLVNWGWRCLEGFNCTGLSGCVCTDPDITAPVVHYTHGVGFSITGGRVYRGDAIPDLDGTYFYAEYQLSKIFSLRYDGTTVTEQVNRTAELDPAGTLAINRITDFGEGPDGELYICDLLHGEIFKIVPDGPFLGVGNALAGTNGEPVLYGTGGVGLGEAGGLHVRSAVESSLAVVFASLASNPTPFFGGTLVPAFPFTLTRNLFTDAGGEINLMWASLGNNPSGLEFYMQVGFDDPGAVFGVALSNAIQVTIP